MAQSLAYRSEYAIIYLTFAKVELGIMDMSRYIGEATAYDKKPMLGRKEPHERSWDLLTSGHKWVNFAFETLRAEDFAQAKLEFVESDFDSLGLVAGGGLLTNAGALLADKSPVRHSRVFCTRWNRLAKSNGVMEALNNAGGRFNFLDTANGFVKVNAKTKWRKLEDGDDFVMVMPRPQSSTVGSVKTVDKSVDWNVDRTCDQVLSILKTNPRATLDQVANVVGLSVRGIEQAIKRLKNAKRIWKVGGKRFGHWEVAE